MRKQRNELGRAVFYTRDSGGKHEQTPIEYLAWAERETDRLGLQFNGTCDAIQEMMRTGAPTIGDLYFDYCVQGHLMKRPALDALKERVKNDQSVSHVFVPRRDRLARPDDPLEGVKLEQDLRMHGITLVFMDRTLPPLKRSGRRDVIETLTTMLDYDVSGKFRQDLSAKVIYAQLRLAKQGYSAGGRPSFGFRRWLVREDATPVRELMAGEIVRQGGHHVMWLPGPQAELDLVRRILEMLETMPAARVARQLTSEGIPSPDSGRKRTDNGVEHAVSGVWHQSTIVNIARNSLLRAIVSYGQRSMGDQYRHSPTGPRALGDEDLRADGKPRVVRNGEAELIRVQGKFEPPVNPELVERVTRLLDLRAGTQRGKPRSRDPGQNPLGGRIYDLNCTWPMYRAPYNGTFRYVCGGYLQSHGHQCSYNHVDGIKAARFSLAAIRHYALRPDRLEQLRVKLQQRATAESQRLNEGKELEAMRGELAATRKKLTVASQNLGLAQTPDQFQAVSRVFDDLKKEEARLLLEVEALEQRPRSTGTAHVELSAALSTLDKLADLAKDRTNLPALTELFRQLNVQLFVRFQPIKLKKRVESRVAGGVLTLGSANPPVEKYSGATATKTLKATRQSTTTSVAADDFRHGSAESLRNVSRGDKI